MPFVPQLAPRWYELGVELFEEEDLSQLSIIQVDYRMDKWRCCLAMLENWTQRYCEPTWHDLITAIKSPGVDLPAVASAIKKNLIGKTLLCTHVYNSVAKQKHPGYKKRKKNGANKKQPYLCATKGFDIS